MSSETFYTTSSLQGNISQMRTWPPHIDPRINHFQAKLSQLTVIRPQNGAISSKSLFQLGRTQQLSCLQETCLLVSVHSPTARQYLIEFAKPTSAAASRSQQGTLAGPLQQGKHSSNTDYFLIFELVMVYQKKVKFPPVTRNFRERPQVITVRNKTSFMGISCVLAI